MKTALSQPKKSRKKIFIILTATLLTIGALWFAFAKPLTEYPLGNQLEYIGQDTYGCYLLCDSNPAAIYYYATNMNVEATATYFKNARLDQQPREFNNTTDFTLKNQTTSQDINIYHHQDKETLLKNYSLQSTEKKYIISIPSFDYPVAKDSL